MTLRRPRINQLGGTARKERLICASGHFHGDRAQKVLLSDVEPAVAQDQVGCGGVKIEVRQDEMVEIILPLHMPLVGRAERERNLTIAACIDVLAVERLEKGQRLGDACLELFERRLVVLKTRRL